jgi:uncharacterized membrane protein
MWLIFAILCFLFNGMSAFFFKINSMKEGTSERLLFGFYLAGSLGSGLYLWYTQSWQWSWQILAAGCIIDLAATLGNLLYSKAIYIGPAGLTATVTHSHVILIVLMSVFLYSENLNWLEAIAILFIIFAVLLLPFLIQIKNYVFKINAGISS